jgi:hypothetical protein
MAYPDYNVTAYGNGIEGFLNWTNALSNNWMISLFLIFIGIGVFVVGKNKGINKFLSLALAGLLLILLVPIFELFTVVNHQIVFMGILAIGAGVGGYFLGK